MTPTDSPARSLGVRPGRRALLAGAAVVLVLLLLATGWVITHPAPLPRSDAKVTVTTPTGTAVYVGLYTQPAGRTIHLAGVRVHATASVKAEVKPLLCRGASLESTSDAGLFCRGLLDPSGQSLEPGDSIVVAVSSARAGAVYVDDLRLAFTEGLRRGTQEAGRQAVVNVVER